MQFGVEERGITVGVGRVVEKAVDIGHLGPQINGLDHPLAGKIAVQNPICGKIMTDLNSLIVFAHVVEVNSFSGAARVLKMPTSTVSRRIAELEDQLGMRLIERSTRKLRLAPIEETRVRPVGRRAK